MTAQGLLHNLTRRGIQFEVRADTLRFRPVEGLSPADLAVLKEHKADIIALLAAEIRNEGCSTEDNEFYWANLRPGDRQYLMDPRPHVAPCAWCGGRAHHHPQCDELRASWEPGIPYPRYRGRKVSEVPTGYLHWLIWHAENMTDDLRVAILARLM